MHNEILFERLLYKHTESLLNLDITFCFLSFLGKKKKTKTIKQKINIQKTSTQILFPPPQHITTTTKEFYFIFKGRNRTAPNVFMESCFSFVCT